MKVVLNLNVTYMFVQIRVETKKGAVHVDIFMYGPQNVSYVWAAPSRTFFPSSGGKVGRRLVTLKCHVYSTWSLLSTWDNASYIFGPLQEDGDSWGPCKIRQKSVQIVRSCFHIHSNCHDKLTSNLLHLMHCSGKCSSRTRWDFSLKSTSQWRKPWWFRLYGWLYDPLL